MVSRKEHKILRGDTMRRICFFIKKHVLKNSLTYNGEILMTYTIEYPEFRSLRNRMCLKNVNAFYENKALDYQKYCESELYPMAIQQYKEDQKNNYAIHVFDAVMKYEVTYLRSCILSLYVDRYEYTGGAHGNTLRDSQTWNLNTCEAIKLAQLLPCLLDQKGYLMNELEEQLKKEPEIYFENAKQLISETFQENSFYCRKDGIVVYYQQYDIAPYSSGIREFLLPYHECVLNPIELCK